MYKDTIFQWIGIYSGW